MMFGYRICILLTLIILSSCSSCSKDDPIIEEETDEIDYTLLQYRGRVEFGSGHTSSFSSPGSSIKLKFYGSTLYATFSTDNYGGNGYSYLYIIIDEMADPESRIIIPIEKQRKEYCIVENLPEGEHTIEIVKNNEAWGVVHFKELRIPKGHLLALPEKKTRLIEFFGDSNPSGWSAWDDKDRGGDNDTESYFSYPGFTARSLEAEWVNVSVGGFGVTTKMGDQNLTKYFNKTHVYSPSNADNSWDFKVNNLGKKPDVVVINLGANDYYNNASKNDIKLAWHHFVTNLLRPVYPEAHVVLANSYGWALNEPTDYLEETIQEFKTKGDHNISYVKFPWLWGQEHAVISEHAGFAQILSNHIAEIMAWEAQTIPYSSMNLESATLGNPSFESSILKSRPDGWRPDTPNSSAQWIQDISDAKDGSAFVRCPQGSGVHQAIPSEKDTKYLIKVWAKAHYGAQGVIKYQFRNQEQASLRAKINVLQPGEQWQQFEFETEAAPPGTWQIDVILKSEPNAIIDFDLIEISKIYSE